MDAAKHMGVSKSTYQTWEWNTYVPGVRQIPAVIAFLGYDWREGGTSFGAILRRARTAAGLTIEELAGTIGVDETTVWRWETDEVVPSPSLLPRMKAWLAAKAADAPAALVAQEDVAPDDAHGTAREGASCTSTSRSDSSG